MADQMPANPDGNRDDTASNGKAGYSLTAPKTSPSGNGEHGKKNRCPEFCERYKMKRKWAKFRRHAPQWIEAGCAVALIIITGFSLITPLNKLACCESLLKSRVGLWR